MNLLYDTLQDMEKWAKSMNAQKEALKDGIKKINIPNLSGKKESATADAGFAILEKTVSRHLWPITRNLMQSTQVDTSLLADFLSIEW